MSDAERAWPRVRLTRAQCGRDRAVRFALFLVNGADKGLQLLAHSYGRDRGAISVPLSLVTDEESVACEGKRPPRASRPGGQEASRCRTAALAGGHSPPGACLPRAASDTLTRFLHTRYSGSPHIVITVHLRDVLAWPQLRSHYVVF